VPHGNASTICCASHSAVGCRVTANQSSCRRMSGASSDQPAKDFRASNATALIPTSRTTSFKCSGRATPLRSYLRAEPPVPPSHSRANACFVHSWRASPPSYWRKRNSGPLILGSERGRRDNSFWLPRVPSVDKEIKKSTTSQMRCAGGVAQCVMKGPPLVERRARSTKKRCSFTHCRHCLGMPTWPAQWRRRGGAEYACAPERPCAVFLLARIRHWNCDRGCEPTQLVERPNRDLGGQSSASRAYPASIIPTLARVMPQNLAVSCCVRTSNPAYRVLRDQRTLSSASKWLPSPQRSLVAHIKSVWSRPQSQPR
jgi:hypothetical protein